jgi:hypothetical protein
MKTHRWFSRNRLVPHLRIASVVTLMSAAAAMAFVAVKPSGPALASSQDRLRNISKFRGDRDEFGSNKRTLPGIDRDGGPMLAAMEDYAHRAYPAKDVPTRATLNAVASFRHVRAMSMGRPSVSAWQSIGPSNADVPDILTFSGTQFFASGRVTALALAPNCGQGHCYLYLGAAGGGIWKTDHALHNNPSQRWEFISGSFGTNAIGTLVIDPTDSTGNTLYAGTGEPNASGDSEAGLGVWKSTDAGNTWRQLAAMIGPITTTSPGTGTNGTYGPGNAFIGRSISSIVVDPTNANHLYVSSARGVRGVSSVTGGGTSNPPTPRPPFGLFESTDGGATFSFIWDGGSACPGTCNGTDPLASIRGVHETALDPHWNGTTNKIVYAADFPGVSGGGGVWRSTNGGSTWTQIKTALNAANNGDRASLAVAPIAGGFTRMYVGDGNTSDSGGNRARFYRTDDAAGAAVFTDLTTSQNIGYCTGQCFYDNVVYSPPGKPDVVYLGGSFSYGTQGFTTNGRAFIRSADAGGSFSDMSWDATTNPTPPGQCCQPNPIAPNGMHPDSHAILEVPGTDIAFFGGDGGIMRSSGVFANISSQCTTYRGLTGSDLALCQQLLSAVPKQLFNLNKGLSTIQFQSLSVAADNSRHLQGGNQDNGTFETYGSLTWPQEIYGDGGQSGFSVTNSSMRFNSFFGQFHDANFQNGDPSKWVIISGPIASSPEGSNFYVPLIADPNPANAGTIFEGSQSVWRTQDWGGSQAFLEANCPEFTTSAFTPTCGDFVQLGGAGLTDLTSAAYGADRAGAFVAAVERAPSDTGTLWVATNTGRVFISKNADAAAGSVTYTRLDTLPSATADPGRFVTGIFVDPSNPNHAWISYSGYNFNTPTTPGHVFEVTYNQGGNDATWTSRDNPGGTAYPDSPATDIVRDSNGDLYVSNDFGVMVLASGSTSWATAGTGLPMVEVAGLTIAPSGRVLYAATHGRSAWKLTLP